MRVLKKLAAVYFLLAFIIPFLLFYPFFLVFLSTPKGYPVANRLRKIWAHVVVFLTAIRPKITYEKRLDKKQHYIIVANHTSYLDIIAIGLSARPQLCFMAKAELGKIPLFGIFFRTVDIAVNRQSTTASHKSFLKAAERLKQGCDIVIFPEGTIGKQVPELGRFKPGAFRLAIDNQVSILPVTFLDNWHILPDDGSLTFSPGRMRIHIHRPVPVSHLKSEDADQLCQQVFSIIEHKLKHEKVIA